MPVTVREMKLYSVKMFETVVTDWLVLHQWNPSVLSGSIEINSVCDQLLIKPAEHVPCVPIPVSSTTII